MVFAFKKFLRARAAFFGIVFFLFVSVLSAQVKDTINGVVTDSVSSAALAGVSVSSGGVSTQTDASGAFSLVFPTTQILVSSESSRISAITWNAKSGRFSWSGLLGNVSISVQDVRGRMAARYASAQGPGNRDVSLADLPHGIFLVTIAVNGRTSVYEIFHILGESGNSFKTITQPSSAGRSFLGKEVATTNSHVVVFSKSGYTAVTLTVAAGTPSSPAIKVKMTVGGTVPGNAIDSVSVPASGSSVTFKTSLDSGQVYLLKAIGSVTAGADQVDAEFQGSADSIGGVDVGIDIGLQRLRQDKTATMPAKTGREKWAGSYNPSHIYYMVVMGTGKSLTLKLTKSGTAAATGAITVALLKLSPYPPQITSTLLDTLLIPVTHTIVHTKIKLAKGTVYLVQCSGQGHVGYNTDGWGDAEYDDYTPDATIAQDVGDCNNDYGVALDDTVASCSMVRHPYWWGLFRADHIYYCIYTGTGNVIGILYCDSGYDDNTTSAIKVKIYTAP